MVDKGKRGRCPGQRPTDGNVKPYKLRVLEIERGMDFAKEASRLLQEGAKLKRIAKDWGISEPTARRYLSLSGERWEQRWVRDAGDPANG
jgi:hypothetical protein